MQTITKPKRKQCNFSVGEPVHSIAFTDCFGKHHAVTPDLIVTSTTYCPPISSLDTLPGYWRVATRYPSGGLAVEGAERFFGIGGAA